MTIPSGCWRGTRGAACADDAKASTKAIANNLIIVTLLLKPSKTGLLPLGGITLLHPLWPQIARAIFAL